MKIAGTEISNIKIGSTTINKIVRNGILYYQTGALIPSNPGVLFWLDGTILNSSGTYYFVDQSGHNRNFLITNYDFDSSWNLGFPYKSAATISAPVGDATLIAADVNNFLYTAGTPNQIPVISLFQDIDYAHKLFTRHSAQVLDSNGVETYEPRVLDIVLYNTTRAGTYLTTCQSYYGVPVEDVNAKWVSPTGNDTTGNGSKSTPWATCFKAYSTATSGATIYVKTGSTLGEYNNTSLRYFYADRTGTTFTFKSLGYCVAKSISTSFVLRAVWGNLNFYRFIIDGENNTDYPIQFYYPGTNSLKLYNCEVKGAGINSVWEDVTDASNKNIFEAYDCIFPNFKDIILNSNGKIYRSLVNCNTYFKLSGEYFYNKHTYNTYSALPVIYGGTLIKYNNITTKSTAFLPINTGEVDLFFNKINFVWTAVTGAVNRVISSSVAGCIPIIKNNSFVCNNTAISDFVYFINLLYCTTPEISNNTFTSLSKTGISDIQIDATATVVGKCKINNNIFWSNTNSGSNNIMVALGGETAYSNKFDESELIGNTFIGSLYSYPNESAGSIHFALLSGGTNFDIRYNKVTYTGIGIVVKTGGTSQSYTKNGIGYNIFYNNKINIWVRGIKDLLINNNSINYYGGIAGIPNTVGINVDENVPMPGNFSENVLLKNNIINGWFDHNVYFDDHAVANGCSLVNNILKNSTANNYILSLSTINYNSVPALQTAGYGSSNIEVDPLFTDQVNNILTLQNTSQGLSSGVDLGVTHNTGLDTSTNWGSNTVLPVIVTKVQGASWDMGAYVH